ncbi:MAG: helix-turn-helix transcriptional regulator [Acidobacteria bacterium]|jgi:YesN/AraC family two-component response regulator|nr:helix-turn-helix transcriptional regulator [Acidobacteriota bacterium]
MSNKKDIFDQVQHHIMTVSDRDLAGLTVSILAFKFNIDRFKLSRQCKSQTGMTLESFLFKEKMTRAAFLLKGNVKITVKEVSEKVGYCTSDYFIRKFKKFHGMAPGKYKYLKAIPAAI